MEEDKIIRNALIKMLSVGDTILNIYANYSASIIIGRYVVVEPPHRNCFNDYVVTCTENGLSCLSLHVSQLHNVDGKLYYSSMMSNSDYVVPKIRELLKRYNEENNLSI